MAVDMGKQGSKTPPHSPPVEDLPRDLYPGQRQAAVYR